MVSDEMRITLDTNHMMVDDTHTLDEKSDDNLDLVVFLNLMVYHQMRIVRTILIGILIPR